MTFGLSLGGGARDTHRVVYLAGEIACEKVLRWGPAWLVHRGQTLLARVPQEMGLYSKMRQAEGGLGPARACPMVLGAYFCLFLAGLAAGAVCPPSWPGTRAASVNSGLGPASLADVRGCVDSGAAPPPSWHVAASRPAGHLASSLSLPP